MDLVAGNDALGFEGFKPLTLPRINRISRLERKRRLYFSVLQFTNPVLFDIEWVVL